MLMLLKYRATESFYEGFQKTSLFADRTVRISAFIFIFYAITFAPFKIFMPSGLKSESVAMVYWILFVFPLSTILIGKMSRKAWKLYAGFGSFYLIGLVPALWGLPVYLLFMIPAFCFLFLFLRAEPSILRCFGYSGKQVTMREIIVALITVCLCVFIIYIATAGLKQTKYVIRPPLIYLLAFLMVVPKYSIVWGILYGVLMKHLLELKFESLVPILFNMFFVMVLWFTEPYDGTDPALIFAATFSWAVILNTISGMAYYFTRTVRPILLAHSLACIIFVSY